MSTYRPKTASLYVLVFPDRNLLKVGKAISVHSRGRALEATWGTIDYAKSYELRSTASMVLRLEKSLHCLLSNFRAAVENGDGYTEMFRVEALDHVVHHIKLLVASNAAAFELQEGIPAPLAVSPPEKSTAKEDLSRSSVGQVIGRVGPMAWAVYSIMKEINDGPSPSITDIAETVGVSNDTIHRAMRTLADFKLLRANKSRGRRNTYSVTGP